jgi:hypothetical protein
MADSPSENSSFYQILVEKMSTTTNSREKFDQFTSQNVSFQSELAPFYSEKYHFKATSHSKYTAFQSEKSTPDISSSAQRHPSRPPTKRDDSPRIRVNCLSYASQITLRVLMGEEKLSFTSDKEFAISADGTVSLQSVKKAYRRRARELHPDLNKGKGSGDFAAFKAATDALFREIQCIVS